LALSFIGRPAHTVGNGFIWEVSRIVLWDWFNGVVGLVAQHPDWALAIAFAAAIIEAVAVFGTVIPGTFILMGVAGAAAASGQPMVPFLIVAIAGAVIGDLVSFWFGHRYRFRLREWRPFARRQHLIAGAERFFSRYGVFSVALCRFVPVLRSLVPLVAGLSGMSRQRFVLANVASALVWAPAHVYPAQFAGLSLEQLQAGDWQTAGLWGAALLVCCTGGWLLHRRLSRSAA
jgi:membrane protein DedA with SNARE-associated domain